VTKVGQNGHVWIDDRANPSVRLVDEPVLVVVDANRAELRLGKMPDLVPLGGSPADEHLGLVIAVEVDLVGPVSHCLVGR
jgi:hypothetical protein